MRVILEDDRVVKEAESPADQSRLRLEERLLRAVAHPGIVALVASDLEAPPFGSLTLARPAGPGLAAVAGQPAEVVAGWGAALTTTVADLHDLGCFHRAVDADHVAFDPAGRPVLCGFEMAVAAGDADEQRVLAGADTAALARLISSRLPSGVDRRLLRLLDRAQAGRRRPPSARALAAALVELVPGAHLEPADPLEPGPRAPGPLETAPPLTATPPPALEPPPSDAGRPQRPSWPRTPAIRRPPLTGRRLGIGLAAATAAAAAFWALGHAGHRATPEASRPAPTHPVKTSAAGPAEADQDLAGPGGRYRLATPAGVEPVVVTGRWGCGPDRPAVLDRRSGSVWLLPYWPGSGGHVAGRLVAGVEGAARLARRGGGPGCDVLEAVRPDGTAVVVGTGAGR